MKYSKILLAVVFLMFSYVQGFTQSNSIEPSSEIPKIKVKVSEKEQKTSHTVKSSEQFKLNNKQQTVLRKTNKPLNLDENQAVLNAKVLKVAPKRKK